MKTLDQLQGDELRRAMRAMVQRFGAVRALCLAFRLGLPPLPSPITPHMGPHTKIQFQTVKP